MKLHWSFTNLIVGTITLSMLSATPALAKIKPPEPCWTCCPNGPLCDDNPDRVHLRAMAGTSLSYGNTLAGGTMLTSSQLYTLAQRVAKWQIEADGNGDMTDLYWGVRNNQTLLTAVKFDTSAFVPTIRSLGSTIVQWQMAYALASWTQAQRVQFVDQVLSYGYDSLVTNAINQIEEVAKMLEYAEQHPGFRPPVRPFCEATMSVMIVWGFMTAIAVATADPVAGVTGLVSAAAGMLWAMGGCM
jgi:hypothetical protein